MVEATETPFKNGFRSRIIRTCWHTWKERNNRVFDDRIAPVQHATDIIKDEAREWAFTGAKALCKLTFFFKRGKRFAIFIN
jgi:hypothetical protein